MKKTELKFRLAIGLSATALLLLIVFGLHQMGDHQPLEIEQITSTVSNGVTGSDQHGAGGKSGAPDNPRNITRNAAQNAPQSVTGNGIPAPITIPDPSKTARSGCFTAKFQHHRSPGHQSKEECSKHQNEVVLSEDNGLMRAFKEKSKVCLKVDGNPVDFEKKGTRVLFSNIAGPESVVTIRYCLGASTCSDPCEPAKDSFMAALGDSGDEQQGAQANGQWDPSDKDDGDVGVEYADVLESEKKQARAGLALSTDWAPETISSGCSVTSVSSR